MWHTKHMYSDSRVIFDTPPDPPVPESRVPKPHR